MGRAVSGDRRARLSPFPGIASPSPPGAALMAVAGVAWAIVLDTRARRRRSVAQNGGNFVRSLPMMLIVSAARAGLPACRDQRSHAGRGVRRGDLRSWLRSVVLGAARAERDACSARPVARPGDHGAGGVVLLREPLSPRVVLSAAIVIGGIALALSANERGERESTAACRERHFTRVQDYATPRELSRRSEASAEPRVLREGEFSR